MRQSKVGNKTGLTKGDRCKSKHTNTQKSGPIIKHTEHAENWPPVCCHATRFKALSDTEEQAVLVIFNGPVIFWKSQCAFIPDGRRQDKVN